MKKHDHRTPRLPDLGHDELGKAFLPLVTPPPPDTARLRPPSDSDRGRQHRPTLRYISKANAISGAHAETPSVSTCNFFDSISHVIAFGTRLVCLVSPHRALESLEFYDMVLTGRRLYYTINAVAGLAIFFFGYDQGMMGGVNTSPDYVRVMKLGYSTYEGPSEGYVATITEPTRQGGIVSIYYLGTLIGCLMGGVLGDRIGRVKTMILGGIWVLLGAALQCSAQNIAWMCCARIINGIGTGYLNAIVPVWSAEVATHTSRGAFIASEFTLNIFGVVVAYWLEFGLGFVGDGRSQIRWRFPIAFQIIPILAFIACVPFMPESPRWLIKMGRLEEAREILGRLRSEDGSVEAPQAQREYDDIIANVALEKEHSKRNSYISMFFGLHDGGLHVARRVQLSIWLQIVQEWVGIAAITVYAPTIFAEAGYAARKSQWLSGLNNITYMLSTLLAVATIDRLGRRIGLWWGAVGQGISLILAGAFSRLLKDNPAKATEYGGAAASFVFMYTFIFGATWLTIPWVYPTETFPLEVRAKGNAFGVVGWSIGNGWLTLLNPVMFARIGENTLHVFGAINFLSIPLVWAFYPETANRTLEEMDYLFMSRSPFVWDEEENFRRMKAEAERNRAEGRMALPDAELPSRIGADGNDRTPSTNSGSVVVNEKF